MNRIIVSALVILSAAFIPLLAHGQVSFDINAVYALPTGDFADTCKPGYGVGAQAFAGLPFLPLKIGGRIAYNHFSAEDDFDDGSTTTIEIMPSIRYMIAPPLSPINGFLQLGLGISNWKSETELAGTTVKDDGTNFSLSVGPGITGKFGPIVGVTVSPLYHVIFTENDKITYLTFNIGLVF